MSLFRCPICAQPLEKQPGRYLCPNGHSYDCAAAGYVHLLPVRQKHSKLPGDDKEMVGRAKTSSQRAIIVRCAWPWRRWRISTPEWNQWWWIPAAERDIIPLEFLID